MSRRHADGPPDVGAVLDRLKGFQRDTAEYAFERLYRAKDSTRRFLVADEVGLGKTLVARGVIAKAIEELWDGIDRIDIVYICSNSQIAAQNVNRLQIGDSKFVQADRLTLLPKAIQGLKQNKVNYLAFTPGTSFDLKSSMGRRDERVLLYHLVQRVWPDAGTGPKNLFQGWVTYVDRWRRRLDEFDDTEQIDAELARAFKVRLQEAGKVPGWGGEDLRRRYLDLCARFHRYRQNVPNEDRADQAAFIGRLRALLAETCVQALEPDLVILDEFQRFKDILDGEDEAAQLAHQLFTYTDDVADVRLLLLSATPYKMYTLHHESDQDDHYRDFLRTVEFLDPGLKESGRFRGLLDNYRQALYRVEDGTQPLAIAKQEIETQLRRVMSRTERTQAAGDATGMLRDVPCSGLQLTVDDVRDFLVLGQVAREVDQPQVLEYWKSAPYLLSFMDDYKLKTEVVAKLARSSGKRLAGLLADGRRVLLSWEEVEAYSRIDPANARLRSLLEWVDRAELWKLLWLPPSLPYYYASGPWDRAREVGLSKRLVFSTWNVVPKAVASLVSYEVERRIVQRFDSSIRNTPEERKKRRPLLRFALTDGRLTGMPVLGMLYPSPSLAELGDPGGLAADGATLVDSLARVRARLEPLLRELTESFLEQERVDESWYWVAPILLDLARDAEDTSEWFGYEDLPRLWSGIKEDGDEDSRWGDHVDLARKVVARSIELGRPPDELLEVLASMAVAGPGTCALRSLTRTSGPAGLLAPKARNAAGQVAWGFRTLFNLPEAMALIRGDRPEDDTPYWRQVVDYCAAGNLQAVLDEYVHTLTDLEGLFDAPDEEAWEGLAKAVVEALSLRTGTPHVDDIRPVNGSAHIEQRRLRNHFAIRFGAQETDDGQAGAREGQVRKAFNSPFWPFVLTSTSVGQEGLDFHAYCHAVVHWNLPSNPVDLEQREGRVHRYKGHAVRKNVATKHGAEALATGSADVWSTLFEIARKQSSNDHGLVPYWLFPLPDGAHIERHVPALPLSRDAYQLEALKRSLAVYRMVFGQPRQDDLMAFLLERLSREQLEEIEPLLRIDLSPGRA
jgi:hypothetical protein